MDHHNFYSNYNAIQYTAFKNNIRWPHRPIQQHLVNPKKKYDLTQKSEKVSIVHKNKFSRGRDLHEKDAKALDNWTHS